MVIRKNGSANMMLAWENLQASEGERHKHASIQLSDIRAVQMYHHLRQFAMFKTLKILKVNGALKAA